MKILIPCCDNQIYDNVLRFFSPTKNSTIIKDIINNFDKKNIIISCFEKYYNEFKKEEIDVCVCENNLGSQIGTICETINKKHIAGPIFIKDGDSSFEAIIKEKDFGYVCVESLNNFKKINVNDKSYVQIDHNNSIINIREKLVISNLFSAGGYYFPDAQKFLFYCNKIMENIQPWHNKIYISDIIGLMILDGLEFEINPVNNYKDYGTREDWLENFSV